MSEPVERAIPAAAVVCLNYTHVLLVQRAREPNRGRWSFPGGKIEPGETARQAAAREVLEETGLRVEVFDVVDVYDAIFPPYHYVVTDFLAIPGGGKLKPQTDVMDARWVPFDEVGQYDITPQMQQVLDRARWLQYARFAAPPSLGLAPVAMEMQFADFWALEGLYVVTDETLPPGRSHVEIARAALEGGARIIQLRDKRRDAGELLPLAEEIRALCRPFGAIFIVNDRVDLAVASNAAGVHLGQTDLPVRAARKMLGPDKLIGVSVENEEQVLQAEREGADYLGVGAIYGSATKPDAGEAVGPGQIARFHAISRLPIVAIGGITLERVPEVVAAGARAIAVVGAVVGAPDPKQAARELRGAYYGSLPAELPGGCSKGESAKRRKHEPPRPR
jgi:thiamine-phosphate pyrophosphorylase